MANQTLEQALKLRPATRQQAKASIVIQGLSGTGKSGLALAIAYYLADEDWNKVGAVDTENKSLDLFEGLQLHTGVKIDPFLKVDLLPMHGYAPTNYLLCRANAIKQGCTAVINDSLTHLWQFKDGVLQQVSALEKANSRVNKFSAWGEPQIIEEKNAIYDIARSNEVHVISTVRVKEKHEMGTVDGKSVVKSLGEQQIMMPDFKYEPDLVIEMLEPGTTLGGAPAVRVIKSRYDIFTKDCTYAMTKQLLLQLKEYLAEGTDPTILQEQQRLELIEVISNTLDTDVSKKTMFPIIKAQLGLADVKLKDISLVNLKTILGMLIN